MNSEREELLNDPDMLSEALSVDGIAYPPEVASHYGTAYLPAQREYEVREYYPKIAEYIRNQAWQELGELLGEQVLSYFDRVIEYRKGKRMG